MAEQNSTLNSAQLQQARAEMQRQLSQAIEAMQLRKWSMEQALATHSSPDVALKFAGEIYDFVSKPALEFKSDK